MIYNNKKRYIYAIGDIHGCYYTLLNLLKKLPKNAHIISLGDLCDKGNYTKEVVQLFIDKNYDLILGNHDIAMINNLFKKDMKKSTWYNDPRYGSDKTIKSYYYSKDVFKKHKEFLIQKPIFLEYKNLFITHGYGMPYYDRRNESKFNKALYSNRITNDTFKSDWEIHLDNNIINLFGHDAFEEIKFGSNYIGIDTGAVYGGKLTAINLNDIINKREAEIIQESVDFRDIK